MAAPIYLRSTHIPQLRIGSGDTAAIRPDWGNALFFKENNDIQSKVLTFSRHVVTEIDEFAPATISQRYYDTHQYWWVVCLYNDILDPTSELYAGREIRIPDRAQVENYLSQTQVSESQLGQFVAV